MEHSQSVSDRPSCRYYGGSGSSDKESGKVPMAMAIAAAVAMVRAVTVAAAVAMLEAEAVVLDGACVCAWGGGT